MPETSQQKTRDHHALRKARYREELAYRQQVGQASDGQRHQEGRRASAAKFTGAEQKRHQQDHPEPEKSF